MVFNLQNPTASPGLLQALMQIQAAQQGQSARALQEGLLGLGGGIGRGIEQKAGREFSAAERDKERDFAVGQQTRQQGAIDARARAARDEQRNQQAFARKPISRAHLEGRFDELPGMDARGATGSEQLDIADLQRRRTADKARTAEDIARREGAVEDRALRGRTVTLAEQKETRLAKTDLFRQGMAKAADVRHNKRLSQFQQSMDMRGTAATDAAARFSRNEIARRRDAWTTDLRSIRSQLTTINAQLENKGFEMTGRLSARLGVLMDEESKLRALVQRADEQLGFDDKVEGSIRNLVSAFVQSGVTDPAQILAQLEAGQPPAPLADWLRRSGKPGIARLIREASR